MSALSTPTGLGTIAVLHTRIVRGSGGGPEKTIMNSPRHLAGTRYRAIACYLRPPDDLGFEVLRRRAADHGCPLVDIVDRWPVSVATVRRLYRLCREHDIRIWHGHDYKTNLLGVALRPLLGFKLVTTVHGWVKHTVRTPLYYAIDRWTLPRHDQVIAVSRDLYDSCLAAGVAADRLDLVENAVDAQEFRRRGPAAAARGRTLPPGRLVVGGAGRLSREKGFDLLIAAVAQLLDEGFDLELWIAGEGEEKERLEAQAARTGHRDRIRFLGFLADAAGLFEAFDLFCLSSRREGLPNAVLEAMAMEVPVLATRCGGMGAFGRDGEDMLLAAPDSADAIAAGLRRLASSGELRARLAMNARRRVLDDCSFRRRMERVVALYDRLWTAERQAHPCSGR